MDDVTKIIDDFISVSKEVHPNLDAPDGSIALSYKRNSFEDLWEAIGELYYTCVAFHISTKCLSVDITDTLAKITLSYKGLKVLLPAYPEEEEGEKKMNKDIVACYGIAAHCGIAKEEAAELIHAISKWERATLPGYYETDTTPAEAKENLIQAVADCQNALDSLVCRLGLDKSTIKQKIKEADERAERLYGRKN